MTACGDGTFCCGGGNWECCNAGKGLFANDNNLVQVGIGADKYPQSSVSSPTAGTAPTVTVMSGATPNGNRTKGISNGAIAGIVVLAVAAFLALAGIVALILMRSRDRRGYAQLQRQLQTCEQRWRDEKTAPFDQQPQELNSTEVTVELEGGIPGSGIDHTKSTRT